MRIRGNAVIILGEPADFLRGFPAVGSRACGFRPASAAGRRCDRRSAADGSHRSNDLPHGSRAVGTFRSRVRIRLGEGGLVCDRLEVRPRGIEPRNALVRALRRRRGPVQDSARPGGRPLPPGESDVAGPTVRPSKAAPDRAGVGSARSGMRDDGDAGPDGRSDRAPRSPPAMRPLGTTI
jgi:hypothetical protein